VARFAGPGLVGLVTFCLYVYCVLDAIASDESLVRNLPKNMWIVLVLFVPGVGSIAWLALGRPLYAGWRPGDTSSRPPRTVVGFEDSDQWTHSRPPSAPARPPVREQPAADNEPDDAEADPKESLAAKERRLLEWEAELKKRENDNGDEDDPVTEDDG